MMCTLDATQAEEPLLPTAYQYDLLYHADTSSSSGNGSDDERGKDGGASGAVPDVRAADGVASGTQPAEPAAPPLQREDWMTKPMQRSNPIDPLPKPVEEKPKDEEPTVVFGLRIMKPQAAAAANGADAAPAPVPDAGPTAPGVGVGDGGASWRLRALRRAQERAREEGKAFKEVVGERYDTITITITTPPSLSPSRYHHHS